MGQDAERERMERAYLAVFDALTYPIGPMGEVVVAHSFRPQLAWFLAMQGFEQAGAPAFKSVATPTALFPDGREWVPMALTEDQIRERLASTRAEPPPEELWRPRAEVRVTTTDEEPER